MLAMVVEEVQVDTSSFAVAMAAVVVAAAGVYSY